MRFVAYLAGGSILAAIIFHVVSGLAGFGAEREIWFGMLVPTLASVISWTALERQKRLNPQKILKCIIQSFVIKSFCFGAYIVVLVKAGQVRPGPFVVCFAFFYLALHIAEAFELRRAQAMSATVDGSSQ
jgi:hypothetical protein